MTSLRRVQLELKSVINAEQWLETVSNDDIYSEQEVFDAEWNLLFREIELMKDIKKYLSK